MSRHILETCPVIIAGKRNHAQDNVKNKTVNANYKNKKKNLKQKSNQNDSLPDNLTEANIPNTTIYEDDVGFWHQLAELNVVSKDICKTYIKIKNILSN